MLRSRIGIHGCNHVSVYHWKEHMVAYQVIECSATDTRQDPLDLSPIVAMSLHWRIHNLSIEEAHIENHDAP